MALAHEARGSVAGALEPLSRALLTAEREGYVRVFVDEGPAMARLLEEARKANIAPTYAPRPLQAYGVGGGQGTCAPGSPNAYAEALLEPLTDREVEVLRLIADGLSNEPIGRRLFTALSTVKGYNRSIFAKLQVARRTEAVARAREVGLL